MVGVEGVRQGAGAIAELSESASAHSSAPFVYSLTFPVMKYLHWCSEEGGKGLA